jgi:SWI/SNF-related matrix-associated actin-dependent regulator of chromatin subfamily A3
MWANFRVISLLVANPKDSGIPYVPFPVGASGTLIVCPLSLLSNWTSQIEQHLAPSTLSVLVFHGANKKDANLDLSKYDVVITSYGTLAADYKSERLEKPDQKPTKSSRSLFGRMWKRVVLDEGHTIRNARTKMSKAAVRLDAVARWSLTGTNLHQHLLIHRNTDY